MIAPEYFLHPTNNVLAFFIFDNESFLIIQTLQFFPAANLTDTVKSHEFMCRCVGMDFSSGIIVAHPFDCRSHSENNCCDHKVTTEKQIQPAPHHR